ncbi:MAG: hypothetical protein J2P28_14005, partial [Actinobacteria bacterium]|nr:hypothetical protein [Actinomycetota bacterium]
MRMERFGSNISSDSRGRAVIAVPFDPDETWGAKAYHPVGGTIEPVAGTGCGRRVRGLITRDDGRWVFTVNPMWMRETGATVGDE